MGAVTSDVAAFHTYLAEHVGTVRLSVLHQRLCDEHGLQASWGTFYRYCQRQWPERMQRTPRVTVRLDDPPPGTEAQVDFFYVARWFDPDMQRMLRLHAFLMTLSYSRHQFLYPVLAEDSATWLEAHVAALLPLPPTPWQAVQWTTAVVHADCHLQLARVRYSVPYAFVGQQLDVRVSTATVEIYAGATLVATHLRTLPGPLPAQRPSLPTGDARRVSAAGSGDWSGDRRGRGHAARPARAFPLTRSAGNCAFGGHLCRAGRSGVCARP